jgi:predicted amidohydrolase YtcJ
MKPTGLIGAPVQSADIDMVLLNGKIFTSDDHDTVVSALAVQNGKILKRGRTNEIKPLAGENTRVIDLDGKTMVPGFIDAHAHIDMYGMMTSSLVVDCRIPALKSAAEILERINAKASSLMEGELILGQGRPSQPYPTRAQLDESAPNHPVIIKASMHWFLLNSRALEKFNVTASHPTDKELLATDPCGFIERDEKTGEPTGYLEECWNVMFPRSQSPFNPVQTTQVIKEGLRKASRFGVTSIAEFLCHPESIRIYQRLLNSGELVARLQLIPCFYGAYKTVDLDEIVNAGLMSGFGNEWIKFGGMKIFLDTHKLAPSCTPQQLSEWFGKAHRAGLRMFMHAISKKVQHRGLVAIEQEAAATGLEGIRAMRHRMEHMGNENLDPGYFHRIQELNAIALPTAYFMNMGPGTLTTPRTAKSFMFKTMLDMGLCVPGNSDSAGAVPEALNPMYQIWCMVNRKAMDGILVSPEEKISVAEALKVYTIHSAYAGREEKIKGSIEVGKLADFAVLAKDPFSVPEEELRHIEVDMTIVNGNIVYQRNQAKPAHLS